MIRIISFNINGLRARPHQLEALKNKYDPDIIALQEIKVSDEDFPRNIPEDLGLNFYNYGQKGFHGVAIFSKLDGHIENTFMKDFEEQKRFIKLETNEFIFINVYVPNGNLIDTDKYKYIPTTMKKKDSFKDKKGSWQN